MCMFSFCRYFPKCWFFTFPSAVYENSICFSPTLESVCLFTFNNSGGCAVILHRGLNLHFPDDYWSWVLFNIFTIHLEYQNNFMILHFKDIKLLYAKKGPCKLASKTFGIITCSIPVFDKLWKSMKIFSNLMKLLLYFTPQS